MKKTDYVLDTHALVFALTAPSKLGAGARRALRRIESGQECGWVPAAVAAELALLHELGRVEIGLSELQDTFESVPTLRFLSLDLAQVADFAALGGIREAFDRFVVAAARSVHAKLITRDQRIVDSKLVQTVWR